MRRLSAIVTSLFVLTFSMSGWGNLCSAMSEAGPHGMQAHHGTSHQHAGSSSHSSHAPEKSGGTDHCQHATSCNGATIAPAVEREAPLVAPAGHVLPPNESLPASQFPDLEPPPPKA